MHKAALYPGTFDPFTIGHLSIVQRGLELFDTIVIAVGINEAKRTYHPLDERMRTIEKSTRGLAGVKVVTYNGLTVDAARQHGCDVILRGVRTVADFEYERNLAYANRNISGIDTVLLYTLPELAYISSTMVRDLERNGYDVSAYVPPTD